MSILNYHNKNAVVQDKVLLLNTKFGEAPEVSNNYADDTGQWFMKFYLFL